MTDQTTTTTTIPLSDGQLAAARDLVDGGKGKIVEPTPQEIVDLHAPKADFARGGIIQPRDHGSELPAKPTTKPKAPAKTEKPADG